MKTKDATDAFGGPISLAKALNITPSAIYQWGDEVPELRAHQIELLMIRRGIELAPAPELSEERGAA